ncbi:transglutaminase domain-containing protein [Candidatus Fermentibacteria bacterium]|nr:transglutaminase domain-containing protein [Candidatus Fermentibacteria bacterium]
MATPMLECLALAAIVCGLDPGACLDHLRSRSPACDLIPAYEDLLEENVALALLARDSIPWASSVPESIFLRYVLPARVSQEPLVAWRPEFMRYTLPIALSSPDLETAALRIGAWCDSICDYRPTQARDQSPLVTWSSGIGRCEELTVFYIDALRSAGIPCRQAYTPWWTVCDDNHAWTEVWTPRGWKFGESAARVDSLGTPPWFAHNASRAGLIVAIAPDSVPGALAFRGGVSVLNVTENYADFAVLRIADDSTAVAVNVVNWGAFRTLATLRPPVREVRLGGGVYMLSWGWPLEMAVVTLAPGDTLVFDCTVPSPLPDYCEMNKEVGDL